MPNIRLTFVLLVLSCLAAPAFAAATGSPANADFGPVCSLNSSTAPAAAPGTPAPTWMLTIVCGNCSDTGCAGQNINTICYNSGSFLGRCGAEPSFPKCSDGHFYCLCDIEPQPGL